MISGWVRYLRLTAEAKTGLSGQIVIWSTVAALGGVFTFFFLILAAFIWLADRYSPLTAALVLAGFFLLAAIGAAVVCMLARQRTISHAKRELAQRSQQPWLDPRMIAVGMQIGRSVGWKRIVPLAAVALLAAGFAKEWFNRDRRAADDQPEA